MRKRGIHKVNCTLCGTDYLVQKCELKYTKFCSRKCLGISNSKRPAWNKGKPYLALMGSKNPKWIADRSLIKQQDRHSNPNYKIWRREILIRDNYQCIQCDFKGWPLQVDHIKSYTYYPKLRFELSNGRTLCVPCHKATDTYGFKIFKTLGIARS